MPAVLATTLILLLATLTVIKTFGTPDTKDGRRELQLMILALTVTATLFALGAYA